MDLIGKIFYYSGFLLVLFYYLDIFFLKSDSGERELETSDHMNKFERNQVLKKFKFKNYRLITQFFL
jgi:hypothetical protein